MPKKNIHSLLIAINDYAKTPLYGCLNDVQAFHDYLKKQYKTDEFKFKTPLILENAKATRQAVIDGFQLFKKATDGDICILYFSGHGSRIPNTDFEDIADGFTEAIVCYDTCLADKELSCLIYETMKDKPDVHFLAVMDCCHSGSNTRFDDGSRIRLCKAENYPLSIKEYYGFKEGLYTPHENGKYSAPKGRHIQFGACRKTETAKERPFGLNIQGAFTYNLLQVLKMPFSTLSYTDLESRIGQKIESYIGEQHPLLDPVHGANPNQAFLGGAVALKNRFFIAWNDSENRWELNAGLYHGVNTDAKHPSVVWLKDDSKILFDLTEIKSDISIGSWRSAAFIADKGTQYNAEVRIGGGQSRLVAFSSDCDAKRKTTLMAYFAKTGTNYIELTENVAEATYFVHTEFKEIKSDDKLKPHFKYAGDNAIWLRLKGEDKPLFFPIEAAEIGQAQAIQFWQDTDSVLQWFHIKELENPSSLIREDVYITLRRSEGVKDWWNVLPKNMELIGDWSKPTPFKYQSGLAPSFALSIGNKGSQSLHISALFMSGRFEIDNSYLPNEIINPNDTVDIVLVNKGRSYKSIGLGIIDELYHDGRKEQMDYIKILASTEPFETTGFLQDPLNVRDTSHTMRDAARGIGLDMDEKSDWATFLLPIHIIRP